MYYKETECVIIDDELTSYTPRCRKEASGFVDPFSVGRRDNKTNRNKTILYRKNYFDDIFE